MAHQALPTLVVATFRSGRGFDWAASNGETLSLGLLVAAVLVLVGLPAVSTLGGSLRPPGPDERERIERAAERVGVRVDAVRVGEASPALVGTREATVAGLPGTGRTLAVSGDVLDGLGDGALAALFASVDGVARRTPVGVALLGLVTVAYWLTNWVGGAFFSLLRGAVSPTSPVPVLGVVVGVGLFVVYLIAAAATVAWFLRWATFQADDDAVARLGDRTVTGTYERLLGIGYPDGGFLTPSLRDRIRRIKGVDGDEGEGGETEQVAEDGTEADRSEAPEPARSDDRPTDGGEATPSDGSPETHD